jgi:hypothetical protein
METLSAVLQEFAKAGSIAALFASTLGLFVFIEKMSSPQALGDFTRYLKSTDFAATVVHLPEDTRGLFQQVFGARHFSWRCVRASVLFSLAAIAGIWGLAFLNRPVAVVELVRTWGFQLLTVLAGWTIWSLVPDYFNLLKTRMVLDIIAARQISRASVLIIILFTDLLLGWVIFQVTFIPVFFFVGELISSGPVEALIDIYYRFKAFGLTYVSLFAPLSYALTIFFLPGMLPSVWLWLYVAATLIVRLAVRTAPLLRFLMYLLDIDKHPIRSVGIVAAMLISGAYTIFLAISKFAQVLTLEEPESSAFSEVFRFTLFLACREHRR